MGIGRADAELKTASARPIPGGISGRIITRHEISPGSMGIGRADAEL